MKAFLTRVALLAGVAALPLALAALPASAGLNTNAVQVVSNGSAGYSLTHSESYANGGVTLHPALTALNIGQLSGGANTGGLGMQLCDPNNGFGGQIGEVSNGKTMSVEYAFGTLHGAAVDNCVGNPLLTNFAQLHPTTLTGITVTDTVDVFMSFRNVHTTVTVCHLVGKKHHKHLVCVHHRVWRGRMKFQAQDETSGFEIFSSPWIHTAADWNLDEAGFGVQQNTNGLSADSPSTCPNGTAPGVSEPAGFFATPPNACPAFLIHPIYNGTTGPNGTGAHATLAAFSGAFVNGDGLGLPPISGPPFIATSTSHEVATTGNGLDANPATTAPNNSGTFGPFTFSFTDFVGNVTS